MYFVNPALLRWRKTKISPVPTCDQIFDHIFYLSPYDRGEGDEGGMYRRNLGPTWQQRRREERGRVFRLGNWEIGLDAGGLDIRRVVYRASDVDRAIARGERVRLRDERGDGGCVVM